MAFYVLAREQRNDEEGNVELVAIMALDCEAAYECGLIKILVAERDRLVGLEKEEKFRIIHVENVESIMRETEFWDDEMPEDKTAEFKEMLAAAQHKTKQGGAQASPTTNGG